MKIIILFIFIIVIIIFTFYIECFILINSLELLVFIDKLYCEVSFLFRKDEIPSIKDEIPSIKDKIYTNPCGPCDPSMCYKKILSFDTFTYYYNILNKPNSCIYCTLKNGEIEQKIESCSIEETYSYLKNLYNFINSNNDQINKTSLFLKFKSNYFKNLYYQSSSLGFLNFYYNFILD